MVYFIATIYFDDKKDKRNYLEYLNAVKPIVEKYHGKYITRSEKITALSSVWRPDRVIVIEFEKREQLERCFGSEEYRQIAFLRESSVDSRAIIVE
ncbi:MAG: DUF1330 domain-containing protein [Eubacterium sp.]|nr:DUF1330 domain-containing protein [Eubacterium sp.]